MMPRLLTQWRIFVYANSMYSLPGLEVDGFREWSPEVYGRSPYDTHRLMNWVNRDVSVLLEKKVKVYAAFELVMDMLPKLKMDSDEFEMALLKHLGPKTKHFIHELINFARSPYEDIIAYECSVQYKARREEGYDGPSTSAQARSFGQFASPGINNFVEFSRFINPDDCAAFEADLELEDEDAEELDDIILERNDNNYLTADESSAVMRRGLGRRLTLPAIPLAGEPVTSGRQQQVAAGDRSSSAYSNYELQLAIERSMLDDAVSNEFVLRPRSSRLPNRLLPQVARRSSNVFRLANPDAAGTGVGASGGGTGASTRAAAGETAAGAGRAAAASSATATAGGSATPPAAAHVRNAINSVVRSRRWALRPIKRERR